jgi:hypothetical protein
MHPIMGLVIAAIVIFIGIYATTQVITSISQAGWTTAANSTYSTVRTTFWNSMQLGAVSLITLAASLVLGSLFFR